MQNILRQVLRAARKEAEAAEAYGERSLHRACLAEGGRRARAETSRQQAVALRVRRRGRWGFAYAQGPLGERGARELAQRAAAAARSAPSPTPLSLPGARSSPTVPGTWDRALASPGLVEEGLEALLQGFASVRGVRMSEARASATLSEVFIANTRGLEASDRGTYVSASATALAGGVSGDEYATARHWGDVDWRGVGRRAAEMARASRNPRRLPPGSRPLLLAPRVMAELMEYTTAAHFSGESLLRGATPYRPGLRAMGPGFWLVDDGRLPGGWSSGRMDGEGVPKRRTDLVRGGRVAGFLYDLATAARARRASTANGARSFRSVPGVAPTNFVLEGPRRRTREMMEERGLWVTEVIGAHTARRASGEFSVAVHRGFRMPEGTPVKGVMLAGSSVELLRGVDAMGDDMETRGFWVSPTVRVAAGALRLTC